MKGQEVTIYGRLGKNPELRRTKREKSFCTFTLAEQVKGEENPRWHNIVMWEKECEHWAKILRKGNPVIVRAVLLSEFLKIVPMLKLMLMLSVLQILKEKE